MENTNTTLRHTSYLLSHRTFFYTALPYKALILSLITALLVTLSINASALDDNQEVAVLEETVVTAQKRTQNPQDVGIAISHFSGEQLHALQINNSTELTRQTTGLMVGTPVGEGNNPNFVLRGVSMNDYADSNEGPIAVYVDGVYSATLAGLSFQLFDLKRVEVLRGPQGTLFGRNATGGLIHYITQRPSDDLEANVRMNLGENQQRQLEVVFNTPINEQVAMRVAYASSRHEGTVKNSLGDDGNDADNQALRLQLLFSPNEQFDALIKLYGSRADSNGPRYTHQASYFDGQTNRVLSDSVDFYGSCAGCDAFGYKDADGDPWTVEQDYPTGLRIGQHGIVSTLSWYNERFELISTSEWSRINKRYFEEVDAGPRPLLHASYHLDGEQLSQELRLQTQFERTHLSAGLYYFQHDLVSQQRADASGFNILDMNVNWEQRTESSAVFAQVEHSLSEHWRLTTGLRYTREKKNFEQRLIDPIAPVMEVNFTPGQPGFRNLDEDYLSGKLQLDWQPAENRLLYASYSRGVKGGGFNAGFLFGLPNSQIPFQREKLSSYELGFKAEFADGRYQFSSAAYYYRYEDFQSFQLVGIGQSVFNADAINKGVELELQGRPSERLSFSLGLSVMDARVADVQRNGEKHDREMVFAPELSANAMLRYSWALAGGQLALQGDIDYVGEHYFDIFNNDSMRESGHAISNAKLSYSSADQSWEVGLWVKNIGDKQYRNYSLDFTDFGYIADMYAPERWLGASLSYHWQ